MTEINTVRFIGVLLVVIAYLLYYIFKKLEAIHKIFREIDEDMRPFSVDALDGERKRITERLCDIIADGINSYYRDRDDVYKEANEVVKKAKVAKPE